MIRQVRAPEFEYPSQNTASSRQKWLAQRSLSPQHSNDRKGRTPGDQPEEVAGSLKIRKPTSTLQASSGTPVSRP